MKVYSNIYYNVHWVENKEHRVRSFELLDHAMHYAKYLVENGYNAMIVPVTMRIP